MASRNLTSAMLAEIVKSKVRPAVLFEGEFSAGSPSNTLRLWTGLGPLTWNGYVWTGGGKLLSLSPIEETREVKASGFTVSFSGLPTADVQRALAVASTAQGQSGTLWIALFDASGVLIADPYQLQRGKLDIVVTEDNGDTCTISAQYESRLVDLRRPRQRLYTSDEQQLDYPGDLGFDQVPALQDAAVSWGGN